MLSVAMCEHVCGAGQASATVQTISADLTAQVPVEIEAAVYIINTINHYGKWNLHLVPSMEYLEICS